MSDMKSISKSVKLTPTERIWIITAAENLITEYENEFNKCQDGAAKACYKLMIENYKSIINKMNVA